MSFMRFNNNVFYRLFYFTANFKQSFKVLMFTTETVFFLTNIVNNTYTGFYNLKMVSGKRLKYQ